jgi:hypothetical protein
MRQLLTLLAIATGCVGIAAAESYSGTLLDAACYTQNQQNQQQNQSGSMQSCTPTSSTSSFAIQTSSGKVYSLDSTGNTKAAEALKSRADRSATPDNATATTVAASITGTRKGDTIQVETVSVQ